MTSQPGYARLAQQKTEENSMSITRIDPEHRMSDATAYF
jgi:hypothetical protein